MVAHALRGARTTALNDGTPPHPIRARGDWTVAGADFKRKATKWRCPTGDCQPKSVWVKADKRHPVVVSKGYDYGFVLQRFRKGSY